MVATFIERSQEMNVSQQIRQQPLGQGPGGKGQHPFDSTNRPGGAVPGTKKGACTTWRSKGYCNKGDACNFQHDESQRGVLAKPKGKAKPKSSAGQRSSSRGSQGSQRSTRSTDSQGRRISTNPEEVCKFYLMGKCKKSHGDCPFVHNKTCWFYANKGTCRKGDKCLFPHRGDKGALIAAKVTDEKSQMPGDKSLAGAEASVNNDSNSAAVTTPKAKPKSKAKSAAKHGSANVAAIAPEG